MNSYAQITVDRKKVRVEYKNETGGPVTDVDDSNCGPYVING